MTQGLVVEPLTPDRWDDVCTLFGPNGAYGGCWCMFWRLPGPTFRAEAGDGLRHRFAGLVGQGRVPGLLAYRDAEPVGWCTLAPREEFGRLQRSPKLKPVDDTPVWSLPCFFVDRRHRGRGVATALLAAAERHAAASGAEVLEAYPLDPRDRRPRNADAYTGVLGMFLDAGFAEVGRRGGRPIVRKPLAAG